MCAHIWDNKEETVKKRGLKGGTHLSWASCPGRVAERTREDCKLGGVRAKSDVNAGAEKEPQDPFHCVLAKEWIESSACSIWGSAAPKLSHKPAPKAYDFHGHGCHSNDSTPWYSFIFSIDLFAKRCDKIPNRLKGESSILAHGFRDSDPCSEGKAPPGAPLSVAVERYSGIFITWVEKAG